jgi:hypothetical protein
MGVESEVGVASYPVRQALLGGETTIRHAELSVTFVSLAYSPVAQADWIQRKSGSVPKVKDLHHRNDSVISEMEPCDARPEWGQGSAYSENIIKLR